MSAAVVYFGGVAYAVDTPPATPGGVVVTVATPSEPTDERPPRLVVVGDSYSQEWTEGPSWPYRVADALGAELVNLAVGGSGYVRAWTVHSTFPSAVARELPADADVVVVFGGLNDEYGDKAPEDVAEAARATFAMVRRLAPGAVLIVVGPQWPGATPPDTELELRDAVRDAAAEAGAAWLDPLAEAWLADPALVGPDGVHPSMPAGQQAIADRLAPVVADALSE